MTGLDEADRLLEVITVDCYNPSEQMTAFYEVFAEQVPLPTTATVVGATVRVVGIDIAEHGEELTARCQRAGGSFRICDFRTWCFLPMRQPPGFTRRTAAVSA